MNELKAKLKVWWYKATDHRHGRTWLEWMSIPAGIAILFIAQHLLEGRPQLLVHVLLALGIGCLAFFAYCFIGEALFHLRVRREQGKTKIHDLR